MPPPSHALNPPDTPRQEQREIVEAMRETDEELANLKSSMQRLKQKMADLKLQRRETLDDLEATKKRLCGLVPDPETLVNSPLDILMPTRSEKLRMLHKSNIRTRKVRSGPLAQRKKAMREEAKKVSEL